MLKLKKYGLLGLLLVSLAATGVFSAWAQEDGAAKRHPEYNMLGRDAKEVNSPDSPLNPNFVMGESPTSRTDLGRFWRSQQISERIVGMWVGDITGDGKNEIVYATLKGVYVARVEGNSLKNIASFQAPLKNRLLSVDVLDIDGNGRKEIIVSNQRDDFSPGGFILGFDADSKDLIVKAENISWYLRVAETAGGPRLVGQRGSDKMRQAYEGKVQYLSFDGTNMKAQGPVELPKAIDLFGFTQGTIGATAQAVTVAIKFPDEHLWVYSLGGQDKIWETHEEYAGTVNHIKMSMGGSDTKYEYLPTRILLEDIDHDGQNEIIVAQNDRGGIPFMGKMRAYSGGTIVAFKYDELSLLEYFRTKRLPGAAVDYQIADFDNNGTKDLVVALVIEAGSGLMEDARSLIIAYELGTAKVTPAKPQKEGKSKKK